MAEAGQNMEQEGAMRRTNLEPEERAYPNGGQTRRGEAICEDGKVRVVWAGIPDTYFTIPAHIRSGGKYVAGYLTSDSNGELHFYQRRRVE